jgi:hypothetical protein
MAIRKKAATDPAGVKAEDKQNYKVEVVHVKTYVAPNGDAYYAGRAYTVSPEKRVELFKFRDPAGVPFFRDYDAARYKKPVKDTPENLNEEVGQPDAQASTQAGEIDTAVAKPEGVVRLPRAMRRTEGGKGVTV